MTILTTTMKLEKPESGDEMEPYFLGTTPSGSYWTILTRLSEHDHTGGLSGKTLTAATIPDGSITPSKLDPSVYDPLTLVDGSKPFTGTQEFLADAVVRDRLSFGEQGTALPPDAWIERAGVNRLRTDSNLGVGVAPTSPLTVQGEVLTQGGTGGYKFASRTNADFYEWYGDAAVAHLYASSAARSLVTVGRTGTVTLAPDAGVVALQANGRVNLNADAYGWSHHPLTDNTYQLGYSALRWASVWSNTGTIQTSAAEAKQDITPLAPEDALAAVRATDPVVFDYRPPERGAEWYELPDDPEQAEAILLQRLTAAPLEAGARHQAGFVLRDETGQFQTDPLFETGEGQSNSANTAGILLAAIQALDTRLAALEGA